VRAVVPFLIEIPAGEFVMGDDRGLPDQRPAHRVLLGAFAMARFAVTRSEYQLYCDDSGAPPPPTWASPLFAHPRQPAVGVSWLEATAFAAWLAERTGRAFRLPSEAERERATRGLEDGRRYPWGENESPDGRSVSVLERPTIVERTIPNALGIQGLADGVHEWCLDWYGEAYYATSPAVAPAGPETGHRRVSRGGSWRHQVITTPSAARSSLPQELHYTDYGFRLVEARAA
jgi:sulfatase modifying factor 1